MKPNEFANLTPEALKARIEELKQEYYQLRANVASGKQQNTASLKVLRRTIAQAKTRLTSSQAVA